MINKKNLIFETLFWGKINPDKVTIKKTPGLLKRSARAKKFIENEWKKQISSGLKTRLNDIRPSRYHLAALK